MFEIFNLDIFTSKFCERINSRKNFQSTTLADEDITLVKSHCNVIQSISKEDENFVERKTKLLRKKICI